ncbi:hypothetical protein D3C75_1237750 [compost metagenome]
MRQWGIGAHSAGIGAFVAVEYRLVVLGSCHRTHRLPVNKRKNRHFLPGQKFFNDNLGAGVPEHLGHHNVT